MKKLSLLAAVAALFMLYSCSEHEPAIEKEQVQFALQLSAAEVESGRSAAELPNGMKLMLSLSNSSGAVLTNHIVNILKLGNSYITEPLELPIGRYSVDDFLIVDNADEVRFAVPKRGSTLSNAVANALPFSFVVGKGKVTTLEMQVIDATRHTPEAFGYVSFNIDVVSPIAISVFIEQDGKLVLTTAHAYIYKGSTDQLEQELILGANVNYIPFRGAHENYYRLVVKKDGYEAYQRWFTYNDLMNELNGSTLRVVLQHPAKAFTITPAASSNNFSFTLIVRDTGNLYVNWGDGVIDTVYFVPNDSVFIPSESSYANVMHYYTGAPMPIKITGDLHRILSFQNHSSITAIDVTELPTLLYLTINDSNLGTLDLRYNSVLYWLYFANTELSTLKLGSGTLSYLELEGNISALTSYKIIESFYQYSIANDVRGVALRTYGLTPYFAPEAQLLIDELERDYDLYVLSF